MKKLPLLLCMLTFSLSIKTMHQEFDGDQFFKDILSPQQPNKISLALYDYSSKGHVENPLNLHNNWNNLVQYLSEADPALIENIKNYLQQSAEITKSH
jgi:hypothetical protein